MLPGTIAFDTFLLAITSALFAVGLYHRLRAAQSRERIDRRQEGVPMLIAIRVVGMACILQIFVLLSNPQWLEWASIPIPAALRWVGAVGYAVTAAWLAWMFVSLGRNITDTVVTRRDATFVDWGPYRFVRNPMYVGLLGLGIFFGVTMQNWSLPACTMLVFALLAKRTVTEERFLLARFGEQYAEYMKRVGRFWPAV